jgi:hypothetical protein
MEVKRPRRYTGPPKGSQEAKERMAKVRAAQWAKNNLVVAQPTNAPSTDYDQPPAPNR